MSGEAALPPVCLFVSPWTAADRIHPVSAAGEFSQPQCPSFRHESYLQEVNVTSEFNLCYMSKFNWKSQLTLECAVEWHCCVHVAISNGSVMLAMQSIEAAEYRGVAIRRESWQ